MKQVLTIALVCALLIAAQAADAVKVKVECKANDACDSKFEYIYTQGTNVTQTVCAKEACVAGDFQAEFVACTDDFTGTACTSKYCIASGLTVCAKDDATTACTTDEKKKTVRACAKCTSDATCTGDATDEYCTIDTVDSTAAAAACYDSDGTTACRYTSYTWEIKDCEKDSAGDACKCCSEFSFSGAKDSGVCIKDMAWYTDEFEKAYKGENFISREFTQLAFLAIVGLFLSFNAL